MSSEPTQPSSERFLHTTHRTIAWFKNAYERDELELAPPFQRNPVWTDIQKSYLIDTVLNGYPIPELYMQDLATSDGKEKHVVVDGQQRIRAVISYAQNQYKLEGDDVAARWRGLSFEDLSTDKKKQIFSYRFVVRILPDMDQEGVRRIFSRLNRNVVALNEQELRNATYWGPFIKTVQQIADDPFWSECGVFSANDHRRMLDHEYISELAIAFLHGPQNKKDKLDYYYQLYEEKFEEKEFLTSSFKKATGEIEQIVPQLPKTRWRKKSDFYTMFLYIVTKQAELPLSSDSRSRFADKLIHFGEEIDRILRLDQENWQAKNNDVVDYARAVSRAASDRINRIVRYNAFEHYVNSQNAHDILGSAEPRREGTEIVYVSDDGAPLHSYSSGK